LQIGTVVLIIICDSIMIEAEKILSLSQKLRKKFKRSGPQVRENLFVFGNSVIENFPKFSAARFFEIKRSIILRILGTITTFLIVMIQFRLNV
jgi:hypothetical protein